MTFQHDLLLGISQVSTKCVNIFALWQKRSGSTNRCLDNKCWPQAQGASLNVEHFDENPEKMKIKTPRRSREKKLYRSRRAKPLSGKV